MTAVSPHLSSIHSSAGTRRGQSVAFEGVSKIYDDGTPAVESLDLECPAGQITVFVGPSGCGKTTTLRMINRTVAPSTGTVSLGGRDIHAMDLTELRRGMGYVIQDAGLFPHRTIVENIATVPRLLGTPRREARRQALELMERVGLDQHLAKRYPYQLSGGQRQRVGVARALAGDPPVLLMDEPFSAVDPVVRAELQEELLRLQRDIEKTIVFVTHDIDEAVRLGDQIAVFTTGRLAQVGTPAKILTDPASDFVDEFVGSDAGVKWSSLLPARDIEPFRPPEDLDGWQLVIDDEGRCQGWRPPGAGDHLVDCRRTVHLASDSLRAVFDALLLSPCHLAPVIDDQDRVVGVVDYASALRALDRQREASR